MATFYVKSQSKGPIKYSQLEAETREDAVAQTVAACPVGEQIEVMDVKADPFPPEPPPPEADAVKAKPKADHDTKADNDKHKR